MACAGERELLGGIAAEGYRSRERLVLERKLLGDIAAGDYRSRRGKACSLKRASGGCNSRGAIEVENGKGLC